MTSYTLIQGNYQWIQEAVQNWIEKHVPIVASKFDYPAEAKKLAIQLGVSTAAAYFLFKVILYRLYINPVNRIPGPKVGWLPFMGNFPEIMREESGVPMKKWGDIYGDMYTFHGPWNIPRVVVTDSVLLKQVLTSNEYDFIKPPEVSAFLRRVLGDGLLTAEGQTHRHQRKMLNPAFSVQAIRSMLPLMAKPGRRLCNKWLDMIKGPDNKVKAENGEAFTEIEISSDLSLATLDVIGWTFGQDFKCLEHAGTPHQSKLSRAYLHILSNDVTIMRALTFIFPALRHLPTERNLKMKRYLRWLEEESKNLVQAGIDRAAEAKKENSVVDDHRPKDLLATMIDLTDEETGKGFTLEEIRNQCLTFMAAGHETTSVSLTWCLWLLAQNQQIQDDLRAEVRTLFHQDEEKTPSYEDIHSLPLLNNVVRETLRLIPPVPTTSRITRVPVVLGSHVLPKGTTIFLSPISTHHSKKIWGDDAEEFNPYRWEGDQLGNTYQYMPFLAGGRQCIGYKFALVEFKILLAILIQNIQYVEKPGFKVAKKQQVTLRPDRNMIIWAKTI